MTNVASPGPHALSWPPAPAPPGAGTPSDRGTRWSEVAFSRPIGFRPVTLDLEVPPHDAPAPLAVWIHGGGFQEGHRRDFPETLAGIDLPGALLAAGIAVALVDYRLSREAPFPAQLHDVKSAIRYVRRHAAALGVDPDRVGAWGESAGGNLAALVGLTPGSPAPGGIDLEGAQGVVGPSSAVSAVVDWYGLADLATMPHDHGHEDFLRSVGVDVDALSATDLAHPLDALLGGPPSQRTAQARAASPTAHAAPTAPPFLLVHGSADRVVPHAQSVELDRLLRRAGARSELVTVPDADHTFTGHDDVAGLVTAAVSFLRRHL